MDNKRMLVEWLPIRYDKQVITEALEKGQPVIVPALLQRADKPNSNGRIYPRNILEREVEKYQRLIDSNMALGELDHPESEPVVNLRNAAIAIREIYWDNNDVKGKVEVLHHVPAGQTIVGLMKHGINIGISSRGVGSTIQTETGHELVDDDFTLLCFDAVSIGSVEGAGFLKESKINLNESFSLDRYATIDKNGKMIPRNAPKNMYENINSILSDILGRSNK